MTTPVTVPTPRGLPVHLSALGFGRNPFPQTPDADCYFRTEGIAQKFAEVQHCVQAGKGFVLLTGEVGTGKSTFLRCLMDALEAADCSVSFVFNTFLQGRELLLAINRDFGLAPGADLSEDIARLNQFLIELHVAGKTCVVVIDDAQNLDTASLELLRLLSNLETRQNKLLQIVLSGQPELLGLLEKPEIRQLASRIVQHIELVPLTLAECMRYIDFRIARAGSDGRLRLTDAAYRAAFQHSAGNPRRLHLILDRCLYGVLASEHREIGKAMVDIAASEAGIAIRPPQTGRNRVLAGAVGAAGIGIALAAIAATQLSAPAPHPAAVAPLSSVAPASAATSTMATIAAIAPFVSCLKDVGAGGWQTVLESGLNAQTQRAIERSLAGDGLALAEVPAALTPAQHSTLESGGICKWRNAVGSWMLWRPAHAPFELVSHRQSESVRWLQQRLAATAGYSATIDGIAGQRTLDALNAFRRTHGIPSSTAVNGWTLYLLEHDSFGPAG